MTYIVAEPCIGTKDHACVDVCPVECFYEGEDMLYIHPEECIDCGACVPECPVAAIFEESDVPEQWKDYIAKNAEPFKGNANPSWKRFAFGSVADRGFRPNRGGCLGPWNLG